MKFNIGDIIKLNSKHPFYYELKKHTGMVVKIYDDNSDDKELNLTNHGLIKILINNRYVNVEKHQIYIPKKFKKI